MGCGAMDWIDLSQNRDRWRAFVNEGMKLGVSKKFRGYSWLAEGRLGSRKRL